MFKLNLLLFNRFRSANSFSFYRNYVPVNNKNICIVGSGPAGFYTAQHLIKNEKNINVDILEKLPVPFGLIRYGVAPDHPEIRNCIKAFTSVANNKQVNFYGNVEVGKDVTVEELLNSYNAVVLAYGASKNKSLNIPGEDSANVLPASSVVGWYTGHPDYVNEKIDLDTEVAAVIGHGNVALDVARILLRDIEELKSTDISENAFEALKKSRIKRVVLIGRRGPLQMACTIKEFREMTNLSGCKVEMLDYEIRNLPIVTEGFSRPQRRFFDLMKTTFLNPEPTASSEDLRRLELKFCRSPKEIISDEKGRVKTLVLTKNKIKGDYSSDAEFEPTDVQDLVDCGLVVKSVGYQSECIDQVIPFNDKKNIVRHRKGKAIDSTGLYCSGWVKTGPVGVILYTMNEAYFTAEKILEDLSNNEIPDTLPSNKEHILHILKERGVQVTTFEDWEKINAIELGNGKLKGKDREKLYTVKDMLSASKR